MLWLVIGGMISGAKKRERRFLEQRGFVIYVPYQMLLAWLNWETEKGFMNTSRDLKCLETVVWKKGAGGGGISVGVATSYGLDGPGIESRWGRDFPHPSTPPL
jgi:hypothetical protein